MSLDTFGVILKSIFVVAVLLFTVSASGWNSVIVPNTTRIDIDYFNNNGFDIENVSGSKVRLYVNEEQEAILQNMGYRVFVQEVPDFDAAYPTIAEINASLQAVVTAHPSIARIEQIGSSVQGREIYAVIISDNVNDDEAEALV